MTAIQSYGRFPNLNWGSTSKNKHHGIRIKIQNRYYKIRFNNLMIKLYTGTHFLSYCYNSCIGNMQPNVRWMKRNIVNQETATQRGMLI